MTLPMLCGVQYFTNSRSGSVDHVKYSHKIGILSAQNGPNINKITINNSGDCITSFFDRHDKKRTSHYKNIDKTYTKHRYKTITGPRMSRDHPLPITSCRFYYSTHITITSLTLYFAVSHDHRI